LLQNAIPAYLATGTDGERTHHGLVAVVMERRLGVETGYARLAGP